MSKNALAPQIYVQLLTMWLLILVCCAVSRLGPNHNKYRTFLKSAKSLIKIQFRSPVQSPLPK